MRSRILRAACAIALLTTSFAQSVELPKEFKYLSEADVGSICAVQTVRAARAARAATGPSDQDAAARVSAYHLATNVWLVLAQAAADAEAAVGKMTPVVVGTNSLNEEELLDYCFSNGMQRFESMTLAKQETIKQAAEQNWSTYVDGTGPVPWHQPSPK